MHDYRVLVSGAGSGIGRAVCRLLAARGSHLVLLGRSRDSLEETRSLLDDVDRHVVIPADIRDQEGLRAGLGNVELEHLHAVVSSAGIGGENQYGPEDRWQEIVDTNLTGTYNLVNELLPYLKASREREDDYRHILVVSSILARLGVPGYTAYCASKAGLLGLVRSWANTFARDNILVNALCPGWVETDMAREGLESFAINTGKTYDEAYEQQMAAVPLHKMSKPEEVASFVAYLISDGQVSITGQTLDINNGALMA